jgi:hypothetical protein
MKKRKESSKSCLLGKREENVNLTTFRAKPPGYKSRIYHRAVLPVIKPRMLRQRGKAQRLELRSYFLVHIGSKISEIS